MSQPPIGIDLGTTYSSVAVVDDQGNHRILPNAEGQYLTPSVVFFEEGGNIVVGDIAKDARADFPENVVEFAKRSMGTNRKYMYGGQTLTAPGVSAVILKKLKQDAEQVLGQPITEAVITVPAHFGAEERDATEKAAQVAGLQALALISEPTAAALAFGMEGDKKGTVLVFDLGGGTFDVTIMRFGVNPDIEVLNVEGDVELGGKDFDDALMELVAERFKQEYGYDIKMDMEALAELRTKAEKAKHDLSARDSTVISVAAGGHRLRIPVTREEFSRAIRPRLEEMKITIQIALEERGLNRSDIDDVLLVGGSTRVPAVREMLTDYFSKPPNTSVHPDEAVALGAVLYAAKMMAAQSPDALLPIVQNRALALPSVQDIVPHSIGTTAVREDDLSDLYNSIILPRGAKLPATATERYFTVEDGQRLVKVEINEAETEDLQFVKLLGETSLHLAEPRPKGSPVDIQISLDLSSVIRVVATDVLSGQKQHLEIRYEETMSQAQVQERAQWLGRQNVT